MSALHVVTTNGKPCWHCHWFVAMTSGGVAAFCSHPGCSRSRAMPYNGCCCWEREPGADDEAAPPPAVGWLDAWEMAPSSLPRPVRVLEALAQERRAAPARGAQRGAEGRPG